MENTFATIQNAIPLEFKLATAEEFSQLFNPELPYGTADGEFFYAADRNAFYGYLVGKYVAANADKLKGTKPKATLMAISEPTKEIAHTCDSYTKLANRVKFLEDAIIHLTQYTE